LLVRAAAAHPDREALVGRLRRYTYAELLEEVEAGAAALHALGVRPGDRVAATAPNEADIMVAFLAVQRLSGIWVGLSKQLSPRELILLLEDSGASVFLADVPARVKLETNDESPDLLRQTIDMEPGDNEWFHLVNRFRGKRAPAIEIDPLAPAGIAYTSGTTGFPKGVVHCQHAMLVVAVHSARRSAAQGVRFRRGATLPMTILNVIMKEALTAFAAGGTCVIMNRLDAAGVAEWIDTERIESIVCSPPTILDFIQREDLLPAMFESIQAMTCGGGSCPQNLRDGFIAKFGKPLYVSWGLTEAPTAVAGGFTDDCHAGASGRAYDHLEIVVRKSTGEESAPGEQGELNVRAISTGPWAHVYTPMLGYWGQRELTEEALQAEELRTGDIGYIDDDRCLFVVARAKLVIVRGGQNISPAEVEQVIKTHPAVIDAAVIGVPDERFGERALAAVQVAKDRTDHGNLREELTALCLQELSKFKCPESWVFLDEMPRNAMMKINRNDLLNYCLDVAGHDVLDAGQSEGGENRMVCPLRADKFHNRIHRRESGPTPEDLPDEQES
jgi:acyl-CoA synthetase (AMP-forming)/AMP-acid ligase II